ncbi:MAG: hypothetical protein U1F54_09065 [Burkholderiales bacterium]
MIARIALACAVSLQVSVALACDDGAVALFACEASNGRRFIELCAPSPIDARTGFLQYRFGRLDKDGAERSVELTYPREREGSLARFHGATYTSQGIYVQSIRFASGDFDYTVFTRAKGSQDLDAGVEVRDRKGGKTTTISCSERPRFYIFELKGLVACDPQTPVGKACIK